MHGVFRHVDAIVVSMKRRELTKRQKRELPVVTRTKDSVVWPAGPGLLMLDYDPPDGGTPLTSSELCDAIYAVVPPIADAPHICRPSASSLLYAEHDGRELRGVRGQRLYVVVQEARDIERAAKVLQARLWLLGHGRFEVSRSGTLLDRTLIDGAVFQPSRLDFAGGANCGTGVVQRLPPPEVYNLSASYLDTQAALPNLAGEEHRRLEELKQDARRAKADDAKVARERWVADRVGEFTAACDEADSDKREARIADYEAACRAAIEDGRLFGDFVIVLDDGATLTVGEILDSPSKYHNRKTLDPVEPDYDGSRPVGWLNLRAGGRPYLLSFAHGGRRYQLIRARKTIRLTIGERADTFAKTLELLRIDSAIYERGGILTRIIGNRTAVVGREWLSLLLARSARFETFARRRKVSLSRSRPTAQSGFPLLS